MTRLDKLCDLLNSVKPPVLTDEQRASIERQQMGSIAGLIVLVGDDHEGRRMARRYLEAGRRGKGESAASFRWPRSVQAMAA